METEKAIVNSGSRRIIGEINRNGEKPGDIVNIKNAWELRCDMFIVPTPQGPVAMHKNSCVPIDAEEEEVDITAKIDNIRWFKDMKDRGRKYDALIDEIKEVMLQTRANRAGIQTAKQMPKENNESKLIL